MNTTKNIVLLLLLLLRVSPTHADQPLLPAHQINFSSIFDFADDNIQTNEPNKKHTAENVLGNLPQKTSEEINHDTVAENQMLSNPNDTPEAQNIQNNLETDHNAATENQKHNEPEKIGEAHNEIQDNQNIGTEPGQEQQEEGLTSQAPSGEIDLNEKNTAQKTENEVKREQETAEIEFYFEDADIQNLLSQISEIYKVTFITDEIVDPMGPGGKALKGNKLSFKTHKPLTKKSAWNLFLTFLDLAGFSLVPEPEPGFYRVVTSDRAQKSPVPTYIGVAPESLPDNDQMIRFVYFIENAEVNTLKEMINTLKSPSARALILQEIKAIVITDKSYNIKSLMQVITELDQITMPQSMSVLKLQRADVTDVKSLYEAVSKTDEGASSPRLFGPRKQSPSLYFPENVRIIAEPRTNSLILLGPLDALRKIEDFITKFVDVELEKPYSPLYTYQLRYANATTVSDIMNNMSQFGSDTPAGRTGGVRGGDKYLKPMSFTPEPATNTIIIKGEYEDYLKAIEIIKKLDEPQPQVAVEALILTLNFDDNKELGAQIRNKVPGPNGLLGNNVDFQTSGIRLGEAPSGIQTNNSGPGTDRLLANLITLVSGKGAGNTVFSLGADAFGVWGIFNILQSITNVQVVSNPFLVATNKTKANVSIGEIRRVVTSTIFAGDEPANAFGDFSAELKLEVTPQINSDGMIILKLNVLFENFISSLASTTEVAKQTRTIDTRTIVADREVIAIGGLIQNRIIDTLTKVPILGDIPILGWLFRNKSKNVIKDNLLILISTRIIEPEVTATVDEHTQQKLEDYYETTETFFDVGEYRDPVSRRFFQSDQEQVDDVVENFLFDRGTMDKEKEIESTAAQEDTETDDRFYHLGKTKDAAVIKRSEQEPSPDDPDPNQSLYRSGLFRQLMDQPEEIRLVEKKQHRQRDARRSLTNFMHANQTGVIT